MSSGGTPLFCDLDKATSEAQILDVFNEILVHPLIFSFSSYESHPKLKKYLNDHAEVVQLLELFQFGTIKGYLANAHAYPQLTERHLSKLRFLTLLTLANQSKTLSHSYLMEELALSDVHLLEDLIIETICSGLIRGRIDEKNRLLRVDFAESRDLRVSDLSPIVAKLDAWSANCEASLRQIAGEMQKADKMKADAKEAADALAARVTEAKNSLKNSMSSRQVAAGGAHRGAMDEDEMQLPAPVRPEKKHKGRKARDEL